MCVESAVKLEAVLAAKKLGNEEADQGQLKQALDGEDKEEAALAKLIALQREEHVAKGSNHQKQRDETGCESQVRLMAILNDGRERGEIGDGLDKLEVPVNMQPQAPVVEGKHETEILQALNDDDPLGNGVWDWNL